MYEIFRWLTFYVKLKYLFVYEWFIEDVMKNLFECRNKKYQMYVQVLDMYVFLHELHSGGKFRKKDAI